jgi:hypothetical protein
MLIPEGLACCVANHIHDLTMDFWKTADAISSFAMIDKICSKARELSPLDKGG